MSEATRRALDDICRALDGEPALAPKPINVNSADPVPVYYGVRGDNGHAVGFDGHVHLWRERERAEAYCRPENRKPTRINCGLFLSAAAWGRVRDLLRLVDGYLRSDAASALLALDAMFGGPLESEPPTEIERHVGGLFVPDRVWENLQDRVDAIICHATENHPDVPHPDEIAIIVDEARQLADILNPETPDD